MAIIPICILIGIFVSGYGIRKFLWDFFKTQYITIEKIHNGIVEEVFDIPLKDLKYDPNTESRSYTDKMGNKYVLDEVFSPVHIKYNQVRYTFKNDNIFPEINEDGIYTKITGVRPKEVLSKDKSGEYFIISNTWIKKMLDTHFVEKIKKEKESGLEAILNFLKSPTGLIIVIAVLFIFGMMMYFSSVGK
jgi:hypothetical protein